MANSQRRGHDKMANSQKKGQKTLSVPYPSTEDTLRDISRAQDEDYFYFAHYDNSIHESFSIKENARLNYHTFVLESIQQCDPNFPFRVAVLAWTARYYHEETNLNDTS